MKTLKWVLIGVLISVSLSLAFYLKVPKSITIDTGVVHADEENFSRTIYGVPDINLDHYRINENKYFDYQVSGVLNVGRENPASFPTWYNNIIQYPGKLLNNPGLMVKVIGILEEGSPGEIEIVNAFKELLAESSKSKELSPEQENDIRYLLTLLGSKVDFSSEEEDIVEEKDKDSKDKKEEITEDKEEDKIEEETVDSDEESVEKDTEADATSNEESLKESSKE